MENTEIKEKLESIEILLSAFINTANDPEKKKAEGEALAKAVESMTSAKNEISGLISQEKALIQNFKPTYEVKNVSVNVKEPLWWIFGAMVAVLISGCVCYGLYNTKEKYKLESETKDWNYMKYKYLQLLWSPEMTKALNDFDKDYSANWAKYDKEIRQREADIEVANKTAANAKLQREAAAKAEQEAREAAKKLR